MKHSSQEVIMLVHDRPYIPTYINENGPFWLLFDTGCIGCSITSRVAQKLGLKEHKDEVTCLQKLRIGSTQWDSIRFSIRDEPTMESLDPDFDGFLGNGFIHYVRDQFHVVVNYPKQTIVFRRNGISTESSCTRRKIFSAGSSRVPIEIKNYYTTMQVHINGTGPYCFFLDTGASRCIVSPELAQALSLPIGESVKAHGVLDSKEAHHSSVSILSIGKANRRDIPVLIMDCSHVSGYVESKVDGYIGHNFLQHFVVTLNYQDEFIVLA